MNLSHFYFFYPSLIRPNETTLYIFPTSCTLVNDDIKCDFRAERMQNRRENENENENQDKDNLLVSP